MTNEFNPHVSEEQQKQRAQALERVAQLQASPRLRVLALATNGLQGVPIQATIVGPFEQILYDTLIHTTHPLDLDSQGYHGIQAAQLVDAPTLAEVMPQLRTLLGEHEDVVGFTLDFLVKALVRGCRAEGIEMLGAAHWISGQELLMPIVGTWNWNTGRWGKIKLLDAIGDMAVPGDFAPLNTCRGNAQRLAAVLDHYAEGKAGAGHPEPDAGDLWGDAGRHEGEPVEA